MTTSTRSSSNTNSNNNRNNDREERTAGSSTTYNHHSPTGSGTGTGSGTAAASIGSTNRVMQADEDFNIRFVNLVRTHKCLYDKKVPEYRNRDNQEKAWVLISKETRESVIHCKERWRNLRACLSRYIKQQSGSEPQHKPYYLTEHMAFLLPFLKSSRNSLEGNSSLATLYQMSQQHLHHHQPHLIHPAIHPHEEHIYCATANLSSNNNNNNNISNSDENMDEALEMKYSISEKDDEETIDAFDPAVTNSLGLKPVPSTPTHSTAHQRSGGGSPTRSDTASADSMKNFIPDVQLAETGSQLMYNDSGRGTPPPLHYHPHSHPHPLSLAMEHHPSSFEPGSKRIKTECEATSTMTTAGSFYGGLSSSEVADMEFFRSILPDLAALTPQQRRKFKIGILELIDDVVTRYPAQDQCNGGGGVASVVNGSGGSSNGGSVKHQRRSSGRDWRKQ
ncbi:myb-like protein H [Drosophila ficusphila]|uniref:myb-like protein H n=1 Tax=Drosophila ficusphila TaxID=30025 RepID=UPI001C8A4763|nr:myb-like protein H [Drosophila ficusphila]XP_043065230.1 myb-like protein H [Drosophila ficusphila]XP_043065231.1 myb-like protein H [Drosophila ficusphila]XP_043065232.1 myb-like protein H [Drosophila ficusphila]